jgi:hypothetical protein
MYFKKNALAYYIAGVVGSCKFRSQSYDRDLKHHEKPSPFWKQLYFLHFQRTL